MAGRPRQPIDLIIAKGKTNLTKADIEERRSSEVQPCADDITAPSYLTASQKKRFDKLSGQLHKIKIMGETDVEVLSRYVVAQENYEQAVKDLRSVQRQRPKGESADVATTVAWVNMLEKVDRRIERYFKQAQAAASTLGLTITARCKLIVPVKDEQPKVNKFAQFGGVKQEGGEPPHVHMH